MLRAVDVLVAYTEICHPTAVFEQASCFSES